MAEYKSVACQTYARWLMFSRTTQTDMDLRYKPVQEEELRTITPRPWVSKGFRRYARGVGTQFRVKKVDARTQTAFSKRRKLKRKREEENNDRLERSMAAIREEFLRDWEMLEGESSAAAPETGMGCDLPRVEPILTNIRDHHL
ncbi:hypothetical protein KPH14_001388 [Odynerus spinipes]|uniref:Uncharacterized protein n=1 Tax=Odynerus spinipes TaxID=1348599 RepID=A0AAD9RD87_9HYME|nr:hypothetical protein KPH14_001388 [Odynerus spinipes]